MGTLRIVDCDLYESDEESRRAAREARMREERVVAAHGSRTWLEVRPDGIEHHSPFVVDRHDRRLFEPMRAGVEV